MFDGDPYAKQGGVLEEEKPLFYGTITRAKRHLIPTLPPEKRLEPARSHRAVFSLA